MFHYCNHNRIPKKRFILVEDAQNARIEKQRVQQIMNPLRGLPNEWWR